MRLGQGYVDPLAVEDPRIDSELARSRQLGDEAVRVLGQLGNLQAPEAVRPAYRTEDLIGLLVGGLLSGGGRELAPMLQGFQQGKLGKAQQDTERNQANYSNKVQQAERQATQLGQRSNSARLAADDLIQGQERRRNTIRQAQQGAMDVEERKEKRLQDARLARIKGIQGAIQNETRTLMANYDKLDTKQRQDVVSRINSFIESNPDIANELLPVFDVPVFGKETPRDILLKADTDLTIQKARLEKVKADNYVRALDSKIKSADSRIEVDKARLAKLVKETELLPEYLAQKAQALAISAYRAEWYANNLNSLVTTRPGRMAVDVVAEKRRILQQQFGSVDAGLKSLAIEMKRNEDEKAKEAQANGTDSDRYMELTKENTMLLDREAELRNAKNALLNQSIDLGNQAEEALAPQAVAPPPISGGLAPLPNVGGQGVLRTPLNDRARPAAPPKPKKSKYKILDVKVTSK
jgi:hypothetical protein